MSDAGVPGPGKAIAAIGKRCLCHVAAGTARAEGEYGFGSPDIGGSAVVTNFVRERGLGDIPVVFSGSYGEAAKFRLAAEKLRAESSAWPVGSPVRYWSRQVDVRRLPRRNNRGLTEVLAVPCWQLMV